VARHPPARRRAPPVSATATATANATATATAKATATAVVLPIRGLGTLLADCLAGLAAQDAPPAQVVVVDDSPDASLPADRLAALTAGSPSPVTLLRSGGVGPYAARNIGWRATSAPVLLFLDARSRPRRPWAGTLAAVFDDPAVALTGSEVHVLGGRSLGARAAERQQSFRLRNYLGAPDFRPYLPTCNLGVRRSDLEAVGGFREVRSGGDADVCWRVLDRPGRRLEPVPEVLMDWVPRDSARDLLEQNYRYGRSSVVLRRDWAAAGARTWPPVPAGVLARRAGMLGLRLAVAAARRDSDAQVDLLTRAAQWSLDYGYRRSYRTPAAAAAAGAATETAAAATETAAAATETATRTAAAAAGTDAAAARVAP